MIVLIVDDQKEKVERITRVITEIFYPDNASISSAGTVNSAITFLLDNPVVDLMVLDLNLPIRENEHVKELSGLTVIKELTRRPTITRPLQIVGLTAQNPIKPEATAFFEREGWVLITFALNNSDWEETIRNRINYDRKKKHSVQKRKIVLLGSAPKNLPGINLGTEHRKIDDAIRMSTYRDNYEVIVKSGGMFSTLIKEFINGKPEILHISGHGDGEGIAMEAEDGSSDYIPIASIHAVLSIGIDKTKCVLLNTCYSAEQAKQLSTLELYVIGMTGSTKDNFAESFSQGFYQGIGEMLGIADAFQLGVARLHASHPHQINNPQLWLSGEKVTIGMTNIIHLRNDVAPNS